MPSGVPDQSPVPPGSPPAAPAGVPTWTYLRDVPRIVGHRRHLVRTVSVAIVVGTLLFCINQLDMVMSGRATALTWMKIASTYLVPFCVANYGILTATRRKLDDSADARSAAP